MGLAEVTSALRDLAVRAEIRDQAIRTLTTWWNDPRYVAYRPQLESLAQRQQWPLLLDSFYRTIPFGTGGRRGPVGIGPNRVNQDTVLTSVQGHVNWLRQRFGTGALRVVVAFDVRVFRDLRGLYDPTVANPLLGMSSRDLAHMACAVYAAHGIEVYTVPGDGDYFLSTPELSFAIRALAAHGGLNISASHNHPDDNGAKFYMPSGGQPIPPQDEEVAQCVEAVSEATTGHFETAVRSGLVRWWDSDRHIDYLEANLACSIDPTARRALIVYSPLHGTGLHTVGDLLPRAGFDLRLVAAQAQANGAFPEVKFRIPNPEVPESMEGVAAEAQRLDADAGLATDPDADRLGVVIPQGDAWRALSGNEIAIMLATYIIETRRERGLLPAQGFLVKTAVTTSLLSRIAYANGLQIVDDLLVGFKYIGHVLDTIEAEGAFGEVRANIDDFVFAAEESNGVQVGTAVRDKDAAGGALLLAELCARLRLPGTTLVAYLEGIFQRYGYAANTAYSIVMEGLAGLERAERMMERLRSTPPAAIEGRVLQRVVDHWNEAQFGPFLSGTDRSARNFVRLEYAGGLQVSVRPSGTEPKIKIYAEQVVEPQPGWNGSGFAVARRALDRAAEDAMLTFVDQLLRSIDVVLPRPALLLSPLVSLSSRIDFAERFLPEIDLRLRAVPATDAATLTAWTDTRLKSYGTDPRALVSAGVAAHFSARELTAAQRQLLADLFP